MSIAVDIHDPTCDTVGSVRISGVPPSEPAWWVARCLDCGGSSHDRTRGPVVAFAVSHECETGDDL